MHYRNLVFFAASPWVVLVALTIWDEDFLAVEHIVTAIAVLSMILAVCRSTIPDEVRNTLSCSFSMSLVFSRSDSLIES